MQYKAEYKRVKTDINGRFTLTKLNDDGSNTVMFDLPARSGQRGYTGTDWQRGKSPIPIGNHKLTLKAVPLQMTPGGDFFPICDDLAKKGIIKGPNQLLRQDIGLHYENQYPGSAGCIVLIWDSPDKKKKADDLFSFLKAHGVHEQFIPLLVTF